MISPRVRSGKFPDPCVLHTIMHTARNGKLCCILKWTLQAVQHTIMHTAGPAGPEVQGTANCTAHYYAHFRERQIIMHTIIYCASCTAHNYAHCSEMQAIHTIMQTEVHFKLCCNQHRKLGFTAVLEEEGQWSSTSSNTCFFWINIVKLDGVGPVDNRPSTD